MNTMMMKMNNFLRDIDSLGQNIGLTHKKATTYKTAVGGFVTVLANIGLFAYFLVLF